MGAGIASVVEKHQSGYGHVHCAVFVDGAVEESDFHPVIDAHLRHCEIAGRDAHDYHSHNEDDRPISIKRIDPNADDMEAIGNLGSYIGEYIASHGRPLFERGIDELAFRAATWATGTQVVRFSNGANELIDQDRDYVKEEKPEVSVKPNPNFDLSEEFRYCLETGTDPTPRKNWRSLPIVGRAVNYYESRKLLAAPSPESIVKPAGGITHRHSKGPVLRVANYRRPDL